MSQTATNPTVLSVSLRRGHHFSKTPALSIRLVAGLGVEGDGHSGAKIKHRSRARYDPDQPNLRQVHLMHRELFAELAAAGFDVKPGDLGENVTTDGLDLLALPAGTRLHLGDAAIVELTGLRNPCIQIDRFQNGLMAQMLGKTDDGRIVRKAGVMGIVIASGDVRPGDPVRVVRPDGPHRPLAPV
jgi:MOSC domain-containing protein YiiM